jgi:hypothetical protein
MWDGGLFRDDGIIQQELAKMTGRSDPNGWPVTRELPIDLRKNHVYPFYPLQQVAR